MMVLAWWVVVVVMGNDQGLRAISREKGTAFPQVMSFLCQKALLSLMVKQLFLGMCIYLSVTLGCACAHVCVCAKRAVLR